MVPTHPTLIIRTDQYYEEVRTMSSQSVPNRTVRFCEEARTMSSQSVNNPEKQEYAVNMPKMYNHEGRNEQFHMLLSTTYGLNASHTKRIHVGLQTTNAGIYEPTVKLTGNSADGIYFNGDSWQQFQNNMGAMSAYLSGDYKLKPTPIVINNISISFTSAYGTRSILVAYKETGEHTTGNTSEKIQHPEEETDSQPASKKRKTYAVAIVMQKTTFHGLENVAKCIDAHLKHLESLTENVNECARYLTTEIELNLPRSYVDRDIVKLTLKGNFYDIEHNVRTQIKNLTFLDMYFNIIFQELISFRFNEILRIIMSNRVQCNFYIRNV